MGLGADITLALTRKLDAIKELLHPLTKAMILGSCSLMLLQNGHKFPRLESHESVLRNKSHSPRIAGTYDPIALRGRGMGRQEMD